MHYDSIGMKALVMVALSGLLGPACTADDPPPEADGTSGTDESGTTTQSSVSATSQGSNASVDTTGGGDSSTGMADGSFLDPDDSSTSNASGSTPQPNGSPCMSADDCESMFCYEIPMLGGICSECLMDEDCGEGTCALTPAGFAQCTDGALGLMCNTDEGCMDELICAELINTGGLFPANFCSECRDDVPCDNGEICTPVYDLQSFAGYLGCAAPGSVADGGGCPIGDGTVCTSGICSTASLLGFVDIGVCGQCNSDADCPGGMCQPATADMTGLMPSVCI